MLRRWLCVFAVVLPILAGAAGKPASNTPPLLDAAVANWLTGKEDWAFTQRMRSVDDHGKVKEEQVTRYDPSLPDDRRWALLELNGKPPPADKKAAWEKSKNAKPRKHSNKPLDELFDFDSAILKKATADQAIYEVAVRPAAARLIQVDKLEIEVAVGRKSQAIERVTAGIRQPMRVALGLATVTGLELDVHFDDVDAAPDGKATASVSKLGDQIDYEWSDFKRVTAYQPVKH